MGRPSAMGCNPAGELGSARSARPLLRIGSVHAGAPTSAPGAAQARVCLAEARKRLVAARVGETERDGVRMLYGTGSSRPRRTGTRGKEPVSKRPVRQTAAGAREESRLVQEYLPLVKTVVGRIQMSQPPQVDPEDLYSAGLIGLLDAIRRFNPRLSSGFKGYAGVRIRGAVLDELRRMDWAPRSVHRKARRVERAVQVLEQRKGRTASAAEIAVELKITLQDYHRLLDEIRPTTFLCLDSAVDPEAEDSPSQYEVLADPNQTDPREEVARRDVAGQLERLINQLPAAQKKVLTLYYLEDLRLREIAAVFGVTESRICQIHAEAIVTMRARMSSPMMRLD
jgi:RNA polymerase sigma factor FliA